MINNRQNGRRRGRGGGPQQMRGPNNGGDRGNRIDNRARGNAAQLLEKYKNLARDAQTQGDRVMTEYYHQFADHYFRVLAESRSRFEDQNQQQRRPRFDNEDYDGEGYEGDGDEAIETEAREPQPEQQQYRRDRGDREDRGNRDDRGNREAYNREANNREDPGNRRERRDYREPVAAAPVEPAPAVEVQQPVTATEDEAPKPRRGRPRKVKPEAEADAPQRIEVDRLPPSFSAVAEDGANGHPGDGDEPAPRKRRTRRASPETDVAA